MAPKGKKGNKGKPSLGDWGSDGEEDSSTLDPIAAAAKADSSTAEAASEDNPQAKQASGKQPKSKKGKKSKGKKALGDWSDEENDVQSLPTAAPVSATSNEDSAPGAVRKGSGAAISFANLAEEVGGSDDDGAPVDDNDEAAVDVSEDESVEPVCMDCYGCLIELCWFPCVKKLQSELLEY